MSGASKIVGPIVVLKFGGSVLRDADALWRAVHEVHRWRRDGHRVVAVVSALAGTTDRLLREVRELSPRPSAHTVAAIAAGGEFESAALLGALLERAGVPARVLAPAAIGLVAEGPAEHARPVGLDPRRVRAALVDDETVVLPGFAAVDGQGRTVLLGRGGSDLTAVFVAAELGARCRLLKDVDGLYDDDPAARSDARRFRRATWADALATDGSVVQHEAVELARDRGLEFELGSLGREDATRVGSEPTAFWEASVDPGRPLRVALLGLGTVGSAVARRLDDLGAAFELTSVLVRDLARTREALPPTVTLTDDPARALRGADVVVEALGGVETAGAIVESLLASGRPVVTANKALVADRGARLGRVAKAAGTTLLHAAAVGGAAPVLERSERLRSRVVRVRGVLNGTANHVLEALASELSLEQAVADARRLGFAEADPGRDLDGRDAADKLRVLAQVLGWSGGPVPVEREPIADDAAPRACEALVDSCALRQVSTLEREGDGAWGRVRLEELDRDDPLAGALGEQNAVVLTLDDGSTLVTRGRGAGGDPTALALLGDLFELRRRWTRSEVGHAR